MRAETGNSWPARTAYLQRRFKLQQAGLREEDVPGRRGLSKRRESAVWVQTGEPPQPFKMRSCKAALEAYGKLHECFHASHPVWRELDKQPLGLSLWPAG